MNKKDYRIPIKGLIKGKAVNFAPCCNPLPGENIVGILTEKKGIDVHLINCSVLERFTNFPELWYELTWDTKLGNHLHTARVSLTVQNKVGSFNKITNCITKLNSNIVDIKDTKMLVKEMAQSAPIDVDKVAKIKEAISSGKYPLDLDKLSDALMQAYREMKS